MRNRKTDPESDGGLAVADPPPATTAAVMCAVVGCMRCTTQGSSIVGDMLCQWCMSVLSREETSNLPYGFHGALAAVAIVINRRLLVHSDVNIFYFTS